ncbi:MAG: DUF6529 family protein [Actinomycetota bacterium]|nr:DUF6529 family protein [Actinomycetota bacterium]
MTAPSDTGPVARQGRGPVNGILAVAVGSAVAIGLGVYGTLHPPSGFSINLPGFSDGRAVKTWLATAAMLPALVQLATAVPMRRTAARPWLAVLHRWSGRAAVLLTVPVAVHCLYALGVQSGAPRVLVHSLLGCAFYGAFVTKMLLLTRHGFPARALAVTGGAVFALLTALWLSSSVWVFGTAGVSF